MSIELSISYKGEDQILRIEDNDIIFFPEGLIGLAEWHRFVLLEDPDEAPIGVLQCIDDARISFLVTDPWQVFSDYSPELSVDDLDQLALERVDDGRVLCVLAARKGPVQVTANLLGPIIINPQTKEARQVVLQDSHYSSQHPVLVAGGVEAGAIG